MQIKAESFKDDAQKQIPGESLEKPIQIEKKEEVLDFLDVPVKPVPVPVEVPVPRANGIIELLQLVDIHY